MVVYCWQIIAAAEETLILVSSYSTAPLNDSDKFQLNTHTHTPLTHFLCEKAIKKHIKLKGPYENLQFVINYICE